MDDYLNALESFYNSDLGDKSILIFLSEVKKKHDVPLGAYLDNRIGQMRILVAFVQDTDFYLKPKFVCTFMNLNIFAGIFDLQPICGCSTKSRAIVSHLAHI